MITLSDLEIKYGDKIIIDSLSHIFETGKIHVILGKSGSGKSTLIRSIAQLTPQSSGSIKGNESVSILFQEGNLFDWLNARDNVMLPFLNEGYSKEEAYNKSSLLLKQMGLSDKELSYPSKLSGGEKQRVALARALGSSKNTILFDEATSALDFDTSLEMLNLIKTINTNASTTMIYVSHKIEEAILIADTISILHKGTFKYSCNNIKHEFGSLEYWNQLKMITEIFDETIKN